MIHTLYEIADELRAIADYGLMYAQNDYDRDRYEKVQKLSARLLGLLESKPETEILKLFQDLKNKLAVPDFRGNLNHISPWNGVYRDEMPPYFDIHHPSPYMPARKA